MFHKFHKFQGFKVEIADDVSRVDSVETLKP
jgi:hypothetical protein